MLKVPQAASPHMNADEYMDDIDLRILRVTDDLRAIQRELNCAAMQASADPELMESLNGLNEMESIEALKSALDQMRHFLWFYTQIVGTDSELGDRLRRAVRQRPSADAPAQNEVSLLDKLKGAADAAMLQFLSDGKVRKPN
ncbi:MAG TPA: hypothetical protein VFI95_17365 [Terriglobales bacterium]|nr:hypothetical protein [Terriglobales bacterium]